MIGAKTINHPISEPRILPEHEKKPVSNEIDDLLKQAEELGIGETPAPAKKDKKKPSFIEQFLDVSTLVQCLLDNPQNYLLLWKLTAKEERQKLLHESLLNLLVNVQDCINFENTV